MQTFDHVSVENLNLSIKTCRALMRSGVCTVGDLKRLLPESNLLQIRLIGKKSLTEIVRALDTLDRNPHLFTLKEKKPVQLPLIEEGMETIDQLAIDSLKLPRAIKNTLKKNGVKTFGTLDLLQKSV